MALASLLLAGLLLSPGAAAPEPIDVSLLSLVTNGHAYHGRKIRVHGYAWFEFEGDALYLHEEDLVAGLTRNAVWLQVRGEQAEAYRPTAGGYAIVEGTFRADRHGHMGLFGGAIEEITRMEPRETRETRRTSRLPILVRGFAPTFPQDVCDSTAFGYDLTIDAQGRVTDVAPVPEFGADLQGALKRRSDEMASVFRRWRFAQRGVAPPFKTRVGVVLLVKETGTPPTELLPELTQDSVVLKRLPCAP